MRFLRFTHADLRKTRKDKVGVSPCFVILLLLMVLALAGTAAAGDEPFDGPANWEIK
jgi:hypothetical protein